MEKGAKERGGVTGKRSVCVFSNKQPTHVYSDIFSSKLEVTLNCRKQNSSL